MNIVIKHDKYKSVNACFSEFIFWCLIKNTNKEKYFAPCVAISKNFDCLIMKRVNKIEKEDMYFEICDEIRSFCNDLGYHETNDIMRNFGLFQNKLVLCDYSIQTKYDKKFLHKLSSLLE